MKKIVWAVAAAVAALGVWKLYAGKEPPRRLRGNVGSADKTGGVFDIVGANGARQSFSVCPETAFYWLASTSSAPDKASFDDLTAGEPVTVWFSPRSPDRAERVILERVK